MTQAAGDKKFIVDRIILVDVAGFGLVGAQAPIRPKKPIQQQYRLYDFECERLPPSHLRAKM